MASEPARISGPAMVVAAARALGKVDLYGSPRGISMISTAEIEAMACLLACFGLTPLPPGTAPPADASTLLTHKGAST